MLTGVKAMGNKVQEAFGYTLMGVNASAQIVSVGEAAISLGGFLCTTAGNIQVTEGTVAAPGASIVAVTAVTVGNFYSIPCTAPLGAVVILTGGASGTFFAG